MQIHELTKRRKTNEGLLDSLKAGIAGAKAVGQAAMSPTFGAVTSNQGALDAAEKSRQAINKKYGLNIQGAKRGAGELVAGSSQADQTQAGQSDVQQQVQAMTQTFTQSPEFADLSQVLPDPGQMLAVQTANGGNYYKDDAGTWYAEAASNNEKPKPVPPAQTKSLDALIGADKYKQVPSILTAPAPVTPTKGTGKKQTAPATTLPPSSTNPVVQEAAGGFNRKALAIKKTKELVAQKIVPIATKNKINVKQIFDTPEAKKAFAQITTIAQAPVSKIKSSKDKKQRLKKAFADYATTTLTGAMGSAGQDNDATPTTDTPASQQEKALAVQTISKSAGIDGAKLNQAAEKDPQLKQALATITKESFDQKLFNELHLLNESQVYITQDIVIRTPKGNYVKSHVDQKWRDPNGTVIDPVKYADYIAKLDATPQAQTRYQADSKNGRGSDTALTKPAPAPQAPSQSPAPQAAPDPVQQIADQQKMAAILRSRDVAGLNSMIQDTFNQLQNAKIFKTGQEDYLKDRMAQLMAMKV